MANEKQTDLISRNKLIAEYDRVHIGPPGGARKLMVDAPAVDAVEVVHGKWIKTYVCDNKRAWGYDCSRCGYDNPRASYYCPNCGAKMDGEIKD